MLHYKCEIVDDHLLLNLRLGHLHHHHESHQVEQHRGKKPENSFRVVPLEEKDIWAEMENKKLKVEILRWDVDVDVLGC